MVIKFFFFKVECIQVCVKCYCGWDYVKKDKVICCIYSFLIFFVVVCFVDYVVEFVEVVEYYFDIDICYNKVMLSLLMYDVGGIIDKDFVLVVDIDQC